MISSLTNMWWVYVGFFLGISVGIFLSFLLFSLLFISDKTTTKGKVYIFLVLIVSMFMFGGFVGWNGSTEVRKNVICQK